MVLQSVDSNRASTSRYIQNSAVFLGFFIIEFCKCFSRGRTNADRNTNFLINALFQIVTDFFIILNTPVTIIKKEEGFIYRVFFNIRCILHIYRSNTPAYVGIKSVVTGEDCNSAALANITDFEIRITAFDSAGLGFLIECDYNSIVV